MPRPYKKLSGSFGQTDSVPRSCYQITIPAEHARTNKLAPTLRKRAGKISARSRLRITLRAGRMSASAHRYCLGMDATVETQSQTGWQHELYDLLRENGITQIAYVPDAGHSILIDRSLADPSVHSIALTTEEEGVALIAGADLGGTRAVLLMQSSGVGNC